MGLNRVGGSHIPKQTSLHPLTVMALVCGAYSVSVWLVSLAGTSITTGVCVLTLGSRELKIFAISHSLEAQTISIRPNALWYSCPSSHLPSAHASPSWYLGLILITNNPMDFIMFDSALLWSFLCRCLPCC